MTESQIEWLLSVNEDTFRRYVARDCNGKISEDASQALRDPRLTRRWRAALDTLWSDIETQFAEQGGKRSPEVTEWRARATRFRQHVRQCRTEAKQAMIEEHNGANSVAVGRLIKAHPEEFRMLLAEARREKSGE